MPTTPNQNTTNTTNTTDTMSTNTMTTNTTDTMTTNTVTTNTTKPGHSKKNIASVRRWWKKGKNIWECSQLTGLSERLVTEIQADHL